MARLADGDRSAFDPVFEALWPVVRAFCVRALGGAADADDAAQAALMRVFSRAVDFDRSRRALPWVVEIAAWECRTVRRRRERRREVRGSFPESVDPDRSPEEAAVESNLQAAALEVLGTLGPRDVETLTSFQGGAHGAQGARFRKRVQRALFRLRLAWRARHGSD